MHYNYLRDYEPGTGRYVESDFIGLGGGVSTYQYVLSRPALLIDKNGEIAQAVGAAFRACVYGCFSNAFTNYLICVGKKKWNGASFSECNSQCQPDKCEAVNQCAQGCISGGIIGGASKAVLGTSMEAAYGATGGVVSSAVDQFNGLFVPPNICKYLYMLGPAGAPPQEDGR